MEFHIEEAEEEKVVHYTRGNTLISMRKDDDTSFYHYDGLGSVRQLTDSEGEVEEYLYDAFGNLIEDNDHNNPYGFTGEQQFREAVGLIFLRARYYDPSVGRFISRDPILKPMMGTYGSFWLVPHLTRTPQRLHSYVYVQNNPVNRIDPTGLIDLCRHRYNLCRAMARARYISCKLDAIILGIDETAGCVIGCLITGPKYLTCLKKCMKKAAKTVAKEKAKCALNYAVQLARCRTEYEDCKRRQRPCN
jgi:RHS repeat-associated protein